MRRCFGLVWRAPWGWVGFCVVAVVRLASGAWRNTRSQREHWDRVAIRAARHENLSLGFTIILKIGKDVGTSDLVNCHRNSSAINLFIYCDPAFASAPDLPRFWPICCNGYLEEPSMPRWKPLLRALFVATAPIRRRLLRIYSGDYP